MAERDEERVTRIERHLAELERLCEHLNEVVRDQGEIIRQLRQQNQKVSQAVETMELDRIRSTSAKPPHYQ